MLLLHGALLMLLMLPTLQRGPPTQRVLLRLQRLPVKPPAPMPARQPAAPGAAAPAALTRLAPASPQQAAALPTALAASVAASAPATLDLRLPLAGPQASRGGRNPSLTDLAAQMRTDPRANSPRLSLEERFAVALGTPCFVDELNAEGQVQRYPGQWVRAPNQSDGIWQGVTGNLGVGGKAPPIAVPVCKRQ